MRNTLKAMMRQEEDDLDINTMLRKAVMKYQKLRDYSARSRDSNDVDSP